MLWHSNFLLKAKKIIFRFYKVPTLPAAIVQIVLCTAQISELKTFTIQANCQHAFITFSKSTYIFLPFTCIPD